MTQTKLIFEDEKRVSERISAGIINFAKSHLRRHAEFHMDELRHYISVMVGPVAPASPDRILRALRARKRLNYVVVDRHTSLYKITEVS